jgi:hypothetical protein
MRTKAEREALATRIIQAWLSSPEQQEITDEGNRRYREEVIEPREQAETYQREQNRIGDKYASWTNERRLTEARQESMATGKYRKTRKDKLDLWLFSGWGGCVVLVMAILLFVGLLLIGGK